ncbi:MAG TPA: hypothetical protein VHI52_23045, partial [Verrucomicrobiae bacterium]|nr:hypothetical protein [Verrucomicrobiae bacterium]
MPESSFPRRDQPGTLVPDSALRCEVAARQGFLLRLVGVAIVSAVLACFVCRAADTNSPPVGVSHLEETNSQ